MGRVTCRVLCKWQLLGLAVRAMVGTGWANSHPRCINRLRNPHSHSFLAGKVVWALNGCLPTCSLMSGHV